MYTKDELMGKLNSETDNDFVLVDEKYTFGRATYLRQNAQRAFVLMFEKAKLEDINIMIVSGFWSFDKQKSIWQAKWDGKRLVEGRNIIELKQSDLEKTKLILKYSAMPGTSRHYWGTDIDLVSVQDEFQKTPEGQRIYSWFCENTMEFGFFQPYKDKVEFQRTGYERRNGTGLSLRLRKRC